MVHVTAKMCHIHALAFPFRETVVGKGQAPAVVRGYVAGGGHELCGAPGAERWID